MVVEIKLNERASYQGVREEQADIHGRGRSDVETQLTILSVVAEFERALLRERQREGIAIAQAKGQVQGGKRALALQAAELRRRVEERGATRLHWLVSLVSAARRSTTTVPRRHSRRRARRPKRWSRALDNRKRRMNS